jgi:hypothetical protein
LPVRKDLRRSKHAKERVLSLEGYRETAAKVNANGITFDHMTSGYGSHGTGWTGESLLPTMAYAAFEMERDSERSNYYNDSNRCAGRRPIRMCTGVDIWSIYTFPHDNSRKG